MLDAVWLAIAHGLGHCEEIDFYIHLIREIDALVLVA